MSTYTPIASQTLGSAATSVTFSSIPQGYTDLILVCNLAVNGTGNNVLCRYNGDTASNYSTTLMSGNGSSAYSARYSNSSNGWLTGYFDGTANEFYTKIIQIQNYSNTTTYKTALGRTSSGSREAMAGVGLWRSTAAITSVTLAASDFNTGSTFSIYGIAGGGFTAKAAGGVVTTDATYAYHTFTTSGAFVPYEALTVDYLVVAGGGGGSSRSGNAGGAGGSGAGGLRSTVTATGGGGSLESALLLTANTYCPVIIGAGGAGSAGGNISGINGNNSTFYNVVSIGGGAGSYQAGINAQSGGSGGGAANNNSGTTEYGAGTTGQGYRGGNGNNSSGNGGAGGGGAGAVGANFNGNSGGNGGAGVAVAISGSSVTYAGGGGGGGYGASGGSGGSGGGGAGSSNASATSATANTGSGGGSSGANTAGTFAGGNGGSGIVIVRYAL